MPQKKPQKIMTPDGIALLKVDCPVEIFDVADAYIMRRKRVAIHKLDAIAACKPGQEAQMYDIFAELIPHWNGVVDVETGEFLPDLIDDPGALTRIDTEQLGWLAKILRQSPAQLASASPKSQNGRM